VPERRYKLLERIVDQVVGRDMARVVDAKDGWPGLIDVETDMGTVSLAAHVGLIGKSFRDRDDVERRFQNPGQEKPIVAPAGLVPVLIGLWEETGHPLLVALAAEPRIGKESRQSLFMPLSLLRRAEISGWAEQYSSTGEPLVAFHPAMLPVYAAAIAAGLHISSRQVESVLNAAGLGEGDEATNGQRARRATTQLVRDALFGRRVCEAYGSLCAMCGFNFSLVQGAHIYPASAPESNDAIWNGISLCHNHHAAFDRHRIYVHPETRKIQIHPEFLAHAGKNEACRLFVENTFPQLSAPELQRGHPKDEMFQRRYSFFDPMYKWAE
jgi:hypothetical protein